jgi:hypothetical protein
LYLLSMNCIFMNFFFFVVTQIGWLFNKTVSIIWGPTDIGNNST